MGRSASRDARSEILAAAERCFSAAGFAGTSVNDIVAGTGFTKPVLYYHFGSKEGLFRALLEDAHDRSFEIFKTQAARSDRLQDQLTDIFAGLFAFFRDRRDLTRLALAAAFAAPGDIPPALRDDSRRKRNFQFIRDLVGAARRRGELQSRFSTHELACGIYGALTFHLIANVLVFPKTHLDRRTAARIVDLFLNGACNR